MVFLDGDGGKQFKDYDLPDWAILLDKQMQLRCTRRTGHLEAGQQATLLKKQAGPSCAPAMIAGCPFPAFESGLARELRWSSVYLADIRLAKGPHLARDPRNYPYVDPRFIVGWLIKLGLLAPDMRLFTPPTLFQEGSAESPRIVSWPAREEQPPGQGIGQPGTGGLLHALQP